MLHKILKILACLKNQMYAFTIHSRLFFFPRFRTDGFWWFDDITQKDQGDRNNGPNKVNTCIRCKGFMHAQHLQKRQKIQRKLKTGIAIVSYKSGSNLRLFNNDNYHQVNRRYHGTEFFIATSGQHTTAKRENVPILLQNGVCMHASVSYQVAKSNRN